jgi:hypothetical protein
MAGRVSQFLSALRAGLVSDVPPEYQACESCREAFCDSVKAANCVDRRYGEQQERSRRFDTARSGTHSIESEVAPGFDVSVARLGAPPSSEVRTRGMGEYRQNQVQEEVVTIPERLRSKNS